MSLPPLPEPCGLSGFTTDQLCSYALAAVEAERDRLVSIVADDAYAMTFQTMGQYRTALLKAIRSEK
jgi:hypothetical protein